MPLNTYDQVLATLRLMAWQRAKAEIQSMLHTYWSQTELARDCFGKVNALAEKFIEEMNELVE